MFLTATAVNHPPEMGLFYSAPPSTDEEPSRRREYPHRHEPVLGDLGVSREVPKVSHGDPRKRDWPFEICDIATVKVAGEGNHDNLLRHLR